MRRVIPFLLLVIALVGATIAGTAAQEASPAPGGGAPTLLPGLGFPELALTTDGQTLDVPAEIEAGRYYLSLTNTSADMMADLELYQLPEGITVDDLLAAFEGEDIPEWFFEMVVPGGVTSMPGGTGGAIVDLMPGEWVFNLYAYGEESDANIPTTVTVTGEMPTVEDPAADVEVSMVDFDFAMPETVPAGPAVWKVSNDGMQPHHVVLFGVPDGTTEDEFMTALMAEMGPPPDAASPEAMDGMDMASPAPGGLNPEDVTEAGGTMIVSAGLATWVELDLAPGTYVAVCFLPTPDGTPHVMLGMVQLFTAE